MLGLECRRVADSTSQQEVWSGLSSCQCY